MRLELQELVIATKNLGKARDFEQLFKPLGIQIKTLRDYPEIPDVVEDGTTFLANAKKKAQTIAEILSLPVLADDSGLCVDALQGQPGVFSARYAGVGASDEDNNLKLLAELHSIDSMKPCSGEPDTGLSPASFHCCLVLYNPQAKRYYHADGRCDGTIISIPRGNNGFGYDPLFYIPELNKTMAELTADQKNKISHRSHAMQKLMGILKGLIN